MALPKQLINCVVEFDSASGTNKAYQLLLQNTDIKAVYEYFSGGPYDEAISGRRISNVRGLRLSVDFAYNAAREDSLLSRVANTSGAGTSASFNSFFNDFYTHFVTNNGQFVRLYFNATLSGLGALPGSYVPLTNYFEMVPTELTYQQTYRNQIGRFVPSISMTGRDLMTYIPNTIKGVL